MFCTNCGTKLEEGGLFCINCGARLAEQAAPVEETPVVPVAEPEAAAPVAEEVAPAAEEVVPAAEEVVPAAEPEAAAPVADVVAPVAVPVAPVIPQNAVKITDWKYSFFDGTFWGLIGVNLLTAFVSAITLGLGAPAMTCYRLRWFYRHTCVGGYRLKFNGKGGQLFGKYLLWGLLTIITIGIFSLWIPIKFKKWEISHVEIESVIPAEK